MNFVEMYLNYLDFYKVIIIFTVILIIFVTFLLFSSDSSILNLENVKDKTANNMESLHKMKIKNENNKKSDKKKNEEKNDKTEIKGFYKNENKGNKFFLSDENVDFNIISKKIIENKNSINDKNEELSLMFIESLSSLNSWKNNDVENQLFKEINWNIEKRERINDDEESLIYQYVFPQSKIKDNIPSIPMVNLASSHSSINTSFDTEDGEEEKSFFSSYKLGICRIFDNSKNNILKSNIVKEINGQFYKIYSQGSPKLIKEKCRQDTIPENYHEIIDKLGKNGSQVIAISGKKMKMNYIQSQRIERNKCESNMIFLGFVVYKANKDDYKSAYS